MTRVDIGAALLVALGGALLLIAIASLPTGSRLRRLCGVDDRDDAGARSNAVVLGGTGAFLLAVAAAIAFEVPDRTIAVAVLGATAAGAVALGGLVRYRDRREILTTPNADRERASRLGGAVMWVGALLSVPLTAVLLEAGELAIAAAALSVAAVSTVLVAAAYR